MDRPTRLHADVHSAGIRRSLRHNGRSRQTSGSLGPDRAGGQPHRNRRWFCSHGAGSSGLPHPCRQGSGSPVTERAAVHLTSDDWRGTTYHRVATGVDHSWRDSCPCPRLPEQRRHTPGHRCSGLRRSGGVFLACLRSVVRADLGSGSVLVGLSLVAFSIHSRTCYIFDTSAAGERVGCHRRRLAEQSQGPDRDPEGAGTRLGCCNGRWKPPLAAPARRGHFEQEGTPAPLRATLLRPGPAAGRPPPRRRARPAGAHRRRPPLPRPRS